MVDEVQRKTMQGIIQTKSVSGSRMLPCLVIFFQGLILIWKCQKWSLNRSTLVSSATAIYQIKCPFTVLGAPFLFFRMLPDDSRLFPAMCNCVRHLLVWPVICLSNNRYIKCKQNIQGWIPVWLPKGWRHLADLIS